MAAYHNVQMTRFEVASHLCGYAATASAAYNPGVSKIDEKVGPHAPGVLEQAVDDDLIVFNPATDAYYTLNRSAREVWELADGSRSAPEIAAVLADRYEVGLEQVLPDVAEIIDGFKTAGLI